jgi:hypothetical protein
MNGRDFVRAIKLTVQEGAVKGTLNALRVPQGRLPAPEGIRRKQWFHALGEDDRQMVVELIREAAGQATYNFLLVLDGLLAIESTERKGTLLLYYAEGQQRTLLNDGVKEALTVLFKKRE